MVKIATQGTDPEKQGGTWINAEGFFHFGIEGAKDQSGDQKPKLSFELVVLASSAEGQAGKKHVEEFNLLGGDEQKTAACFNRLLKFACAIGLYSEVQWKEDTANGVEFDFDIESAIGRQFCTKVTLKPGTKNPNQKFANIGFDFWAVGDEEADGTPKNSEWVTVVADEQGRLPTRAGGMRKPGTLSANKANGNGNGQYKPQSNPAAHKPPSKPVAAAAAGAGDIPF